MPTLGGEQRLEMALDCEADADDKLASPRFDGPAATQTQHSIPEKMEVGDSCSHATRAVQNSAGAKESTSHSVQNAGSARELNSNVQPLEALLESLLGRVPPDEPMELPEKDWDMAQPIYTTVQRE